ncbi:unnamed protein product [Allacma fusca]|uniref:Uncharacterized protein n=1 Tax=Allacma fusca TaxID=39272 RepID=A0A8J2PJ73_9HEXA|nr:unnamed protein product [Allacma fusca]
MFKLYKSMGREPFSERRDATTGHDRFCNNHHKIELPRHRRRRNPNKRTQAETELAFELTSYSGDSSESPIYASSFNMCRSVSEIQWPNHNFGSSDFSDEPPPICPPEPGPTMFLQNNCSDHAHDFSSRGFHHYSNNERQNTTSWGTISKFFSSVATTLTCRNYRKEGAKFSPLPRLDNNA